MKRFCCQVYKDEYMNLQQIYFLFNTLNWYLGHFSDSFCAGIVEIPFLLTWIFFFHFNLLICFFLCLDKMNWQFNNCTPMLFDRAVEMSWSIKSSKFLFHYRSNINTIKLNQQVLLLIWFLPQMSVTFYMSKLITSQIWIVKLSQFAALSNLINFTLTQLCSICACTMRKRSLFWPCCCYWLLSSSPDRQN